MSVDQLLMLTFEVNININHQSQVYWATPANINSVKKGCLCIHKRHICRMYIATDEVADYVYTERTNQAPPHFPDLTVQVPSKVTVLHRFDQLHPCDLI